MSSSKTLETDSRILLQFEKRGGLIPVIVQDFMTYDILMLGYTNDLAFERTLESRLATFWSTSREALWTKGETSGDYLKIREILVDCDQDALIYQVEKLGKGVCHTLDADGSHRPTCFYRKIDWNTMELKFSPSENTPS